MTNTIKTKIWKDVPTENCSFTTAQAHCYGFDVYNDLVPNASYFEYLYLTFTGQAGSRGVIKVLELIAKSILNLGPRNASVHAAMSSAIGQAPVAAQLISAISVNAGAFYGSQDMFRAQLCWEATPAVAELTLQNWFQAFSLNNSDLDAVLWGEVSHTPGFNPTSSSSVPVISVLEQCIKIYDMPRSTWLFNNLAEIENKLKAALSFSGLCAVIFHEIGLSKEASQALFLILSLPGAAAHAIEQKELGFKSFPFFKLDTRYDIKP